MPHCRLCFCKQHRFAVAASAWPLIPVGQIIGHPDWGFRASPPSHHKYSATVCRVGHSRILQNTRIHLSSYRSTTHCLNYRQLRQINHWRHFRFKTVGNKNKRRSTLTRMWFIQFRRHIKKWVDESEHVCHAFPAAIKRNEMKFNYSNVLTQKADR